MMALCCASIELLEELLEKGSAGLVSDVGCGALCCAAALRAPASISSSTPRPCRTAPWPPIWMPRQIRCCASICPRARRVADEVGHRLRKEGLSMGEIWKGAPVAAALCASLTGRISALRAAGVEPALAILRAGERGRRHRL